MLGRLNEFGFRRAFRNRFRTTLNNQSISLDVKLALSVAGGNIIRTLSVLRENDVSHLSQTKININQRENNSSAKLQEITY